MSKSEKFLETFFSPPNLLTYEEMVLEPTPEISSILESSLAAVRSEEGFALLPMASDVTTTWYGIAYSEASWRELRALLYAFIGPTYSSFRGSSLPMSHENIVDMRVNSSGARVLKFEVWPYGNRSNQRSVRAAIRQLQDLRKKVPVPIQKGATATWRVLKDIELALGAGEVEIAHGLYEELRQRHALHEPNSTFLNIRIYAASDRWSRILELPQLPLIIDLPRPPLVSDAIIRAIHMHLISPIIAENRVATDMERGAWQRYDKLFFSDPPLLDRETGLTAIIVALSSNPRRLAQAKRLLEGPQTESTRVIVERLLDLNLDTVLSPISVPTNPLVEAEMAANAGDMQAVMELLREAEPSPQRSFLLFRAAMSVQSLESAQLAVAALPEMRELTRTSELGAAWLTKFKRLIGGTGNAPTNWVEWASRLASSDSFPSAAEIAELGAIEWRQEKEDLQELSRLIERVPEINGVSLVSSIPFVLEAFPIESAGPNHLPLYTALLERLAFGDQVTEQEQACSLRLTEAGLRLSQNKDGYNDLIDVLCIIWSAIASPSALEWATDVAQLLAYYPCPSETARQGFLSIVSDRAVLFSNFVSPVIRQSLSMACEIGGLPKPVWKTLSPKEEPAVDVSWHRLNGTTIAIHSLTESASAQASKVLSQLAPGCKVRINSDHTYSQQLAALAQNSDVFVLVTHSAKHAASVPIVAERGDLPLLRPDGRGSSSILRTIENWLKDTP